MLATPGAQLWSRQWGIIHAAHFVGPFLGVACRFRLMNETSYFPRKTARFSMRDTVSWWASHDIRGILLWWRMHITSDLADLAIPGYRQTSSSARRTELTHEALPGDRYHEDASRYRRRHVIPVFKGKVRSYLWSGLPSLGVRLHARDRVESSTASPCLARLASPSVCGTHPPALCIA